MADKPNYEKLKITSGVISSDLTKSISGEIIATGDKLIVVRTESGLEEVVLDKTNNNLKVKDKIIISEHGVLTEHLRLVSSKVEKTTTARSGAMRCPVNT